MSDALYRLSTAALRELASSLKDGKLSSGIGSHALSQIVGPGMVSEVSGLLSELQRQGWTAQQMGILVASVAEAMDRPCSPDKLFDIVLSGPDVPGTSTRDTAAVMHTLIEEATEEIVLIVFAVYDGKRLFEPLARKMEKQAQLKVRLCLNIPRKPNDTSLDSEVVKRFVSEFRAKHWPWETVPEVFYDPRSLSIDPAQRASLHAKCLIVDRKTALVTSANFTEAAQYRNIEAGVIIRHAPIVQRMAVYFDGLRQSVLKKIIFENFSR